MTGIERSPGHLQTGTQVAGEKGESLFERFPWLYAFCREHLFRDDTDKIAEHLWNAATPPSGSVLLELGCGPGFYARGLAQRYPQLRVFGVDQSLHQVELARERANALNLRNCRFMEADALDLPWPDASVHALVISRLFTVLPEPDRSLAEIHRTLRPGGKVFIAEPRSRIRAAAPLLLMWMLAKVISPFLDLHGSYREPGTVTILNDKRFNDLVHLQPWAEVRQWSDNWYQYAVCEKA